MCAFSSSLNRASVSTREARILYRDYVHSGNRAALVASMRKVNAAMGAIRLAGYNLADMRRTSAVSAACGRVYHYTLAARERELYELYDLVSVQLTPTERLKTAH